MKKTVYPILYILGDVLATAFSTVFCWALRNNLRFDINITPFSLLMFFAVSSVIAVICGVIFRTYYNEWEYVGV
ncbi:MAG: hypothetical protein IJ519_05890, partial [Clostridia bacterium]|nr:hypothetical protein [Clostridia bacterium]